MAERLTIGISARSELESQTAGEFLRVKAQQRGISTKELADAIGCDPSTIRRAFRRLGRTQARIGFRMMGEIIGYQSEDQENDVNQQIRDDWDRVNELLDKEL